MSISGELVEELVRRIAALEREVERLRVVEATTGASGTVPNPSARGQVLRSNATPAWETLGAATAGAVLIGDGTDVTSDTTPTLVGDLTLDDGSGDSPGVVLVGGSNDDQAVIRLIDNGTANYSDLRLTLPGSDANSQFEIWTPLSNQVAYIDGNGDLGFSRYLYHLGDTDTYVDMQNDRITLQAGGVDMLDLVEGASDYITAGALLNCTTASIRIKQHTGTTSAVPTDAQFDTATSSTPSGVGSGYLAVVWDSTNGRMWLLTSNGSDWYYWQMSLAL